MPETKTVVLVLLVICVFAKSISSIKNKKIRNTIIIVVDASALVVCIKLLSLLEDMFVLLGIGFFSLAWFAGIERRKRIFDSKSLDNLKDADIPGLLVALGLTVIYFVYLFKIKLVSYL